MDDIKERMKPSDEKEELSEDTTGYVRSVLVNAIKMQSLYADGKIRFVETSILIN